MTASRGSAWLRVSRGDRLMVTWFPFLSSSTCNSLHFPFGPAVKSWHAQRHIGFHYFHSYEGATLDSSRDIQHPPPTSASAHTPTLVIIPLTFINDHLWWQIQANSDRPWEILLYFHWKMKPRATEVTITSVNQISKGQPSIIKRVCLWLTKIIINLLWGWVEGGRFYRLYPSCCVWVLTDRKSVV